MPCEFIGKGDDDCITRRSISKLGTACLNQYDKDVCSNACYNLNCPSYSFLRDKRDIFEAQVEEQEIMDKVKKGEI